MRIGNKNLLAMKKIILALLSGAFFNASAQITLTEADAPSIGDSIFEIVDTVVTSGLTAGPIGEDVVWDFTSLGNSYVDTTLYVDPATVDVNNEFPTANLASVGQDTSYMHKGAEGIALLGMKADPLNVKLDNPFYFMRFPFTYGDNFCDTLHFVVTIPYDTNVSGIQIDSVRLTMDVIAHDTAVAYGTVKVPGETFDNTLIIKDVSDNHQVVSVYNSTFGTWMDVQDTSFVSVSYSAYINGYGGAVLTINMADDGTVKSANYKYNEQAANRGVAYNVAELKLYPNPATSKFYIENNAGASVEIYDMAGNMVKSVTDAGKNATIDVSGLKSGAYIVKVKDGGAVKVTKLNITR